MKRIKDPKKVVTRDKLKKLAFWVTSCAEYGLSPDDVNNFVKELEEKKQAAQK